MGQRFVSTVKRMRRLTWAQVRARRLGLDCLSPIYWHKIANGVTEATGNGAGFYGKPFQPGAIVKNDVEFILFLRNPLQTAQQIVGVVNGEPARAIRERLQDLLIRRGRLGYMRQDSARLAVGVVVVIAIPG